MKRMNEADMKAMIGTEFKYVFKDGDHIPALVAAFDPEIGLTCLCSGTLITRDGYDFAKRVDENGNMCMIGINSKNYEREVFLMEVSEHLEEIASTGAYQVTEAGGQASCSF